MEIYKLEGDVKRSGEGEPKDEWHDRLDRYKVVRI